MARPRARRRDGDARRGRAGVRQSADVRAKPLPLPRVCSVSVANRETPAGDGATRGRTKRVNRRLRVSGCDVERVVPGPCSTACPRPWRASWALGHQTIATAMTGAKEQVAGPTKRQPGPAVCRIARQTDAKSGKTRTPPTSREAKEFPGIAGIHVPGPHD